ncbi:MAG TPA: penicillin-binding transpeptidase domain-containing protein [Verrucomicrobiae bacterium]|nr:penicillin-binding transpeptidase domain-containing protein [Verrucomicrobiae bacterium]
MILAPQKGRALIVVGALASAFTALSFRLFDLHVLQHKELSALAQANREQVVHRQGRRGAILDVNGDLLANSLSVRIVTADGTVTGPQAGVIAEKLAPLLKVDVATLTQKLSSPSRYIRLNPRVKLDDDAVQRIRAMKLKGIYFEDQFVRSYPNGPLASHVIGFVDAEHKGVQGIEASMDEYLEGQAGYEVIERDRKGREIRALRSENLGPRDGYNVVLTIDQVIQHIAEQELEKAMARFRPQSAVIIVSRPKTGEILAMSSRPTFDPANLDASSPDARRNRCVSDVAEPGSTFKIVVCSGALNEGVVSLSDQFNCENGAFMYAGRVLHDAHPYGVLSVEEILFHSSNIGAAKVGLRLGPARLYEYIRRFGFGRKTGIALPGEVSGIAHPLSQWSGLSVTRIPMGHEIAVTPLQMIMAMNAIADGGTLMKPMVVKSVVDQDGTPVFQYQPQPVGQVIAPRTAQLMTVALRKVVSPEGTAPQAAVQNFDVAGKTGTAQKIENGQYVRKYYSSFIGYFPAANPQVSILVSLDDPTEGAYYGGSVAGPVFRAVAEKVAQYLGIEPQTQQAQVAQLS